MKHRDSLSALVFALSVYAMQAFGAPSAHAGPLFELDQKVVVKQDAPLDDHWRFTVALPAFVPTLRGDTGLNGTTSHAVTGFNEVANKIDMAAGATVEAQKGKLGFRADFSYSSISDGFGVGRLVRKADFQADQMLGDFGASWRLLEGRKGFLDVIGGIRYTYNYEQIKLQGDSGNIRRAADRLAALGTVVRSGIELERFKLDVRSQQRLNRPNPILESLKDLDGNLRDIKASQGERADRIDKALTSKLNGRASRTDQWVDPYFGLRGRYNFTDKLYLVGRADIAPFDVGCDFGWQAWGGFGYQLSKRVSYELVYRALHMDYRHDGLIYDQTMYGPEGTLIVSF